MGVWDSLSTQIDKLVEAAKREAEAAGEKAQQLGDMGARAIEKARLELEKDKLVKELGRVVAVMFVTDGAAEVKASDSSVSDIVGKIKDAEAAISKLS